MIELTTASSQIKDRVYERYLEDRVIIINEDITEDVIERVVMPILKWNEIDNEKEEKQKDFKRDDKKNIIRVYINSCGGECYSGLSVISAIESSKTPVYTYGMGKMLSMGLPILSSGHKRFMQTCGTLMYHDVHQFLGYGTNTQHKQSINEGERIANMIDDILIKNTKLTKEMLNKVRETKSDWYIGSEEALKLEIVHELF